MERGGQSAPLRVLLVDPDEAFAASACRSLEQARPRVVELERAATYAAGLAAVRERRCDAYVIDYRLDEGNGLALLEEARRLHPEAPAILIDRSGLLVESPLWRVDEPGRFAALRAATGGPPHPPGRGIPGRVVRGGSPVRIPDVRQEPDFSRGAAGEDLGVGAAFAFPVLVGSEVVAVLEFFSVASGRKSRCGRRRRWSPWDGSPAAWPTTSTTCSPSSTATPTCS